MEIFRSMNISATGAEASRLRMETVSNNLANAESSSSDPAKVFRPQRVRLEEAFEKKDVPVGVPLKSAGVAASLEFQPDSEPIALHDPTHPDANADGMVLYPNVDTAAEMTEMLAARRAYEASLAAYSQTKETFLSTLDIVRS